MLETSRGVTFKQCFRFTQWIKHCLSVWVPLLVISDPVCACSPQHFVLGLWEMLMILCPLIWWSVRTRSRFFHSSWCIPVPTEGSTLCHAVFHCLQWVCSWTERRKHPHVIGDCNCWSGAFEWKKLTDMKTYNVGACVEDFEEIFKFLL